MTLRHDSKDDVIASFERLLEEESIDDATATLHFMGEAWVNDYAVTTDFTTTFTIPLDDLRQDGEWLLDGLGFDNHHVADHLKTHENAPEKVQKWQGPFTISVETYGV